jgi:large subunit ribosomal protein L22
VHRALCTTWEEAETVLGEIGVIEASARQLAAEADQEIAAIRANLKERLDEDDLVVKAVTVDEGPTLKRMQPAAMGRGMPLKKRTSHVRIIVATKEH